MKSYIRPCVLAALAAFTFCAQAWPDKPVRIIVPYPPGGAVDVVTRKMAAKLQEQTGQTFFVENKSGATGTIGLSSVVQAAPDGYTLAANDTTYALLPHIFKKLPFDHEKDLLPVGAYVFAPMGVVVKADSKFKTLGDLVAAAKVEANRVSYGTGGAGSAPHFVSEALGIAAGANFLHVPFKGAGPALQDVVAGRVDVLFDQVSSSSSFIEQGRVTPLAVSSTERWKSLPQTPTFIESGLSTFAITNFTGLVAPAGTPPEIVGILQRAAATALEDEAVKKSFASMGVQAVGEGPAQFSQLIREDLQRWAALIRDKGIKLD